MQTVKIYLSLATAMLASGCGILNPFQDNDYSVANITSDTTDKPSEVEKLRRSLVAQKFIDQSCFEAAGSTNSNCQAGRNNVMYEIITRSDVACNDHLKSMYVNDAAYNVILGSLTSLFAGAASVVSGVRAKSNFAALGFFSSAERSLINDEVYKTILVPAIHTKIVETRALKRAGLRELFLKPVEKYPTPLALSDAVEYHYSCSFMDGMRQALKEGTNETKALVLRDQARRAETDMTQARMLLAAMKGISLDKLTDADLSKDTAFSEAKARFIQSSRHFNQAQASVVGYLPIDVTSLDPEVTASVDLVRLQKAAVAQVVSEVALMKTEIEPFAATAGPAVAALLKAGAATTAVQVEAIPLGLAATSAALVAALVKCDGPAKAATADLSVALAEFDTAVDAKKPEITAKVARLRGAANRIASDIRWQQDEAVNARKLVDAILGAIKPAKEFPSEQHAKNLIKAVTDIKAGTELCKT